MPGQWKKVHLSEVRRKAQAASFTATGELSQRNCSQPTNPVCSFLFFPAYTQSYKKGENQPSEKKCSLFHLDNIAQNSSKAISIVFYTIRMLQLFPFCFLWGGDGAPLPPTIFHPPRARSPETLHNLGNKRNTLYLKESSATWSPDLAAAAGQRI